MLSENAKQTDVHERLRSNRAVTQARDSLVHTSLLPAPALHHGLLNPQPRRTCLVLWQRPH